MEEGSWSQFALLLEQQHHANVGDKRARNGVQHDDAGRALQKRLRILEDSVAKLGDAQHRSISAHISPLSHLALKKTARRVFWENPCPDADSISVLRNLIAQTPLRDDGAKGPILDDDARDMYLDQCAAFQDASHLAMSLLLVDQEHLLEACRQHTEVHRQHMWNMAAERDKTLQAHQSLNEAHCRIKELESKLKSTEEELDATRHAYSDTNNKLDDAQHHLQYIRTNTRSIARQHAEAICGHMSKALERERKYLLEETSGKWANAFQIPKKAVDGLHSVNRRVFIRLRVTLDAGIDTAAIPPSVSPPRNGYDRVNGIREGSPQVMGRDLLRASAPPARHIPQQPPSSPTYAPNGGNARVPQGGEWGPPENF